VEQLMTIAIPTTRHIAALSNERRDAIKTVGNGYEWNDRQGPACTAADKKFS